MNALIHFPGAFDEEYIVGFEKAFINDLSMW